MSLVKGVVFIPHFIVATRISGLTGMPPFEFSITDISGFANKWNKTRNRYSVYNIYRMSLLWGVTDKENHAVPIHTCGEERRWRGDQ